MVEDYYLRQVNTVNKRSFCSVHSGVTS